MTAKIRYRCEHGTTRNARLRFKHVSRLGDVTRIYGYRFHAKRSRGFSEPCTIQFERVMVKGDNGSCRFDGLCWGYAGEGPHGLFALLTQIGVPSDLATQVAFKSNREHQDNIDWMLVKTDGVWSLQPFKGCLDALCRKQGKVA